MNSGFRSFRSVPTAAVLLATAMQAFDGTIVNVALPAIERSLGTDAQTGAWILTAYLATAAAAMPLTGWLRARYGGGRIFATAVLGFAAAAAFCGLAPNVMALIGARTVQGACAGVILPLTQALLLDLYPKDRHPAALAAWGAAIVSGPVIGPLLGGALVNFAGWPWIFYIYVPFGMLAFLGSRGLRDAIEGTPAASSATLDLCGAILLVLFVGALEIALQRAAAAGSRELSEITAELAMASLASLILICHLRKAPHPVIRIGVFRDTNFAVAILINVAVGVVIFGTITLVPALVQGPLGRDALLAGLVMAPRGMATLAGMAVMGRVATHANARLLLFLGLTVTSIALLMMALPSTQTDVGWLAFASFLQGVGAGVLFTPLSVLAFSTLPAAARTEASGCYNLTRQIGSACGVAIVSGIISSTNLPDAILPLTEIDSPQPLPASVGGYSTALALLAGIMLAVTPLVPFFNAPRRARAAATLADAVPPTEPNPTGLARQPSVESPLPLQCSPRFTERSPRRRLRPR